MAKAKQGGKGGTSVDLSARWSAAVALVSEADAAGAARLGLTGTRYAHLGKLAEVARRDADDLIGTVVDDAPITADEIDLYRFGVAQLAGDVSTGGRGARTALGEASAGALGELDDATLLSRGRGAQKVILRALDLRFGRDAKQSALLSKIREGKGADDLRDDHEALRPVIEGDRYGAWFASLTRGEPEAWQLHTAVVDEIARRASSRPAESVQARDARREKRTSLGQRLGLVHAIEKRLRAAGRYHYTDTVKRDDYRAYVAPRRAKRRTKATG